MKVALVYDWVDTPYGGAEQVLLDLHQLFPQAPLYTSVYFPSQAPWAQIFPEIKTSFLQFWPIVRKHHALMLPFLSLAFESFNFDGFDLVISVTSSLAKNILTKPGQLHLCYLLTPPRYLYSHEQDYRSSFKQPLLNYLTQIDQVGASRPDKIVAISRLVSERCEQIYHRKSDGIVYPVTSHLRPQLTAGSKRNGLLVVARLVKYKKIDLIIKACLKLNQQLTIVGDGPDRKRLEKIAMKQPGLIAFKGRVSHRELEKYFQTSQVLVMPGIEDFGITALEAASFGLPIILHRQSGAAEILASNPQTILLSDLKVTSLAQAILAAFNLKPISPSRAWAKYDTTSFVDQFKILIKEWLP